MQGRIVIPIRNKAHELVGYAGRSIDGQEPKYRFPAGFHKSQELFQLHRARQAGTDTVIIVEGFFDAAKVWQAGNRNVVALMGSSLSESQAGLLEKHFRSAVLMLDGDAAGQKATTVIASRLGSSDGSDDHPIARRQATRSTRIQRDQRNRSRSRSGGTRIRTLIVFCCAPLWCTSGIMG